jgi:hypothetical protein
MEKRDDAARVLQEISGCEVSSGRSYMFLLRLRDAKLASLFTDV